RSLYQEAESVFADLLAHQVEVERIGHRLSDIDADDPEMEILLQRQGELQHLLEGRDIFRIRPMIEQILFGLGFSVSDLEKDVSVFSGGWLMRLLLAKLLLKKPSLLLMDEPTNHLDLDSLTWLEEFLLGYQGAMIIISHDRSFLDRVTSITWELSLGRLTVFRGNYSHYLLEKSSRMELERAAYDNQQAKIRQTQRFIERFRSKSTKASQVQSRIKQLEKMDLIELDETEREVRFTFPPAASCGRDVLMVDNLTKRFGHRTIFENMSLNLQRGDKLAVVGVNGAGKTTFLKILAGLEKAEGNIRLGHNVVMSYFGQHQARELHGDSTILETIYHSADDMSITRVRSLLGAFLFSGDEVEKKVKVLSGGEKSRVALAKMLVRPANFMLLDEPTNHLDISSQEVLQEAMAQYEGAIILVSHNRYFANGFVNKVLEIRDSKVTLYEGNIEDYLEKSKAAFKTRSLSAGADTGGTKTDNINTVADKKELRRQRAKVRQELSGKLNPWKKQVSAAEAEIELLEKRKVELEAAMADPALYDDRNAWSETSKEYDKLTRRLERIYSQWEEAQGHIEEIEAEMARALEAE
ncbi:MAG: ABC-F family ATP-binding cassette domain-containing protein, partial [Desulfobulbaceae bacterium]|nr:ABC-F family ATP-binding cassette domain-containing protein [Desulfobulbaceae bacterium]